MYVQAWLREYICASVQTCDYVCICTGGEQPYELGQT